MSQREKRHCRAEDAQLLENVPALFHPALNFGRSAPKYCAWFRVRVPTEEVVVSPADGVVTYIGRKKNPLEDNKDVNTYKKVSIFLSVFDVHVNRMPIKGSIHSKHYIPY